MSEAASPSRLAVVVHEVRSPVAALMSIRDLVRAEDVDAAALSELVRLALAACAALERLVRDASLASLDVRSVDLAALLRDVAATARLHEDRVRVPVELDLPAVVLDPVRIRQALDNLVANALAQAGNGEVVVDGRLAGDSVVVSVTDSGPGIPPGEQERIFEPGVRLGASYPGSGLGLALVKAIAEAHGGRAEVRSVPGEGSTFSLVLPLAPS